MINAHASDIHVQGAYNGTSWTPEQREQGQINNYLTLMEQVGNEFGTWATADNKDAMTVDLERFRQGYAERLNRFFDAHSRVASQLVTGVGGWTVATCRANEKRCDTADKRMAEVCDYRDRMLSKLRNIYDPKRQGNAAIGTNDPNAPDLLWARIEELKARHADMVKVNRIISDMQDYDLFMRTK